MVPDEDVSIVQIRQNPAESKMETAHMYPNQRSSLNGGSKIMLIMRGADCRKTIKWTIVCMIKMCAFKSHILNQRHSHSCYFKTDCRINWPSSLQSCTLMLRWAAKPVSPVSFSVPHKNVGLPNVPAMILTMVQLDVGQPT